jgi:hypothetical protein
MMDDEMVWMVDLHHTGGGGGYVSRGNFGCMS